MNRRNVLKGTAAAGLAGAAGLSTSAMAANPKLPKLDLDDPVSRARIRAKIAGSTKAATVHGLAVLHVYAYLNDGNLRPMFTFYNYTTTKWEPKSDRLFAMKHYEAGIYCTFDTMDVLEYWDNPFTGDRREVFHFITGPISGQLGPDGMVTGPEATVKPRSQGIQVIGDFVYVPYQSGFSFPNRFKRAEFPKESAGDTFYWDSFSTASARLVDVADPKLDSVRASSQFQNLVSWAPWFGMGGIQGRTFGRAYGNKLLGGWSEVPKLLQDGFAKYTPGILDVSNWTEFRDDSKEYMDKIRKPS